MKHRDKRSFLKASVALLTLTAVTGLAVGKTNTSKPNILFLFTDDQRNDTIHALGNEVIQTPHMDRLVKNGTAFANAYIMGASSAAVCAPSRACLLSGRTLWNLENQGSWQYEISDKFKTLPQVFHENGYASFGTGKQHNGSESFARSFSTGDKILFKGMTSSQYKLPLQSFSPTGDYHKKNEVMHEGKYSAEIYADACIQFLEGQAESKQPFFAYVAFQTPHDPRQAPDEYMAMYKGPEMTLPASFKPKHPFDNGMLRVRDEGLASTPRVPGKIQKHIADYYAMITHTDAQIGRILEVLEKTGKLGDTIIVFASDNGLAVGRHGLMGKQNIYDHSVHVPLVISGPGIPRGEIREQLCYIYDIYPTLCERAGLKTPDTVEFKSLNAVINNKTTAHRDHLYFAFMNWQRGIQNNKYKLIEYCVKGKRYTQLFNLQEDPEEIQNLAGNPEHTKRIEKLRAILEKDRIRLNDGNTPFEFTDKQGRDFWGMYEEIEDIGSP